MAKRKAPTIVLLGNYALDRQESMLRFRDLLSEQLSSRKFDRRSISPNVCMGALFSRSKINKWPAYVDKYVLFPFVLWLKLACLRSTRPRSRVIVHICDHSNAVYVRLARFWAPVLVTCHDLLAVRGAFGEDTDCPATELGKFLQGAILRGLRQANMVVCVSRSTQSDLVRLAGREISNRSQIIPLAINYPYRMQTKEATRERLQRAGLDLTPSDYILHVGSGLRRKNREALLHATAGIGDRWKGKIVFAGLPLDAAQWELAQSLDLRQRIVEVNNPANELLLALYNGAHALVFMSRFEGFGWPVLEAQASGCPVICSNRTSVPEVAGEGALLADPEDHASVGQYILRLRDSDFRQALIEKGLENAGRFTTERMMKAYETAYDQLSFANE